MADEVAHYAVAFDKETAVEHSMPILAKWIESHSNLRIEETFPLPEIRFRTQAELNELLFYPGTKTVAIYDVDFNVLYLNKNFSFSEVEIGNLMHETAHWLMNHSGLNKQFECLEATDIVTYALEKNWSEELNLKFYLTAKQVHEYTSCLR